MYFRVGQVLKTLLLGHCLQETWAVERAVLEACGDLAAETKFTVAGRSPSLMFVVGSWWVVDLVACYFAGHGPYGSWTRPAP